MASNIKNIEDLKDVLHKKWSELDNMNPRYLSEAGHAAKEAYKAVIWTAAFHPDLKSLYNDEDLGELLTISGKHNEYYKVLQKIMKAIENTLKEEKS